MKNPIRAAAEAIAARLVPLKLTYRLNGIELFHETLTPAEMKKRGLGIEPILILLRDNGMEPAGKLQQSASSADHKTVLTVPVTAGGHAAVFTAEIQPSFTR